MATTPLDLDVSGADVGRRGEWRVVLRHRLPLRVMHWINLLCMLVLVGSGLLGRLRLRLRLGWRRQGGAGQAKGGNGEGLVAAPVM